MGGGGENSCVFAPSSSLPTCLLADKLTYLFGIVGRFDYTIESGVSEDFGKAAVGKTETKEGEDSRVRRRELVGDGCNSQTKKWATKPGQPRKTTLFSSLPESFRQQQRLLMTMMM